MRDMIRRGVWRKVKRSSVPSERRVIGNRWVFKLKGNGVYCARLVGLGYAQIPGVDHQDNFSPVLVDVTFRVVIVILLVCGPMAEIVDVETDFLYGELEEEIYMDLPVGFNEVMELEGNNDECVVLDRAIYWLVQDARQFFKKLLEILVGKLGFTKCMPDNFLLTCTTASGTLILCVYIDDTLCIGNQKCIDKFKKDIKEHFTVKEEGKMK